MNLEAERQVKNKEIQTLNEKVIRLEARKDILEKELENMNKKMKINEDLLTMKEK